MTRGKENIIVLLGSFAVFAAGVWALWHEPAPWRPYVLWGSFVVLGLVAVRQTVVKMKKR